MLKWIAVSVLLAASGSAQQFTVVDEAGYAKLVAAHKGKVLLVDFWATWCVPCRKETPAIVKMVGELAGRGLDFAAISADEPEQRAAALRFLRDYKVPGTPYVKMFADDDKFAQRVDTKWNEFSLPAVILYDKTGKKVAAFLGETPTATIEAAVRKLL